MKPSHHRELVQDLNAGNYEQTDEGLLIRKGVLARGKYTDYINGELVGETLNLVPAEGITYLLGAGIKGSSAISSWFLALYSGNVAPASNWAAANFVANASEITSSTEGYSQAARVAWVPGSVVANKLTNAAAAARFNVVCTSTLNVAGAALLSSQTKGGSTGTLMSATRYGNVRTLGNGDAYDLVYELELLDV